MLYSMALSMAVNSAIIYRYLIIKSEALVMHFDIALVSNEGSSDSRHDHFRTICMINYCLCQHEPWYKGDGMGIILDEIFDLRNIGELFSGFPKTSRADLEFDMMVASEIPRDTMQFTAISMAFISAMKTEASGLSLQRRCSSS
ncbi:hypothetical protein CEXT_145151 [Caerostris extrusa]|uniref:Uncharacterized protein n=1 Tax=Caerostris extrusa TaxID=172846 RepID=A0AAV4PW09_CAEEX|nr:hypothetical protein CEXT_145151 [Caerostris extrusa]